MQRQSLGSPNSKLSSHGGGGGVGSLTSPKQNPHMATTERRDSLSPSSSLTDYDDDDNKSLKPRRLSLSQSSSTSAKPENLIHLIPVLTLVCFLVLYLSSHSPSQSDLAQFPRFKRSSKHLDSTEISGGVTGVGRYVELQTSDILAIRSLRNLQESRNLVSKSRSPRKFADF